MSLRTVKLLKPILLGLAVTFVAIQFARPARNIAAQPSANDITARHPTPPAVKALLAAACYDCHSNTTRYPWYTNVQPVAWWLASHVSDGRRHLNFSEFATYDPKKAAHKLEEIVDEVNEGDMPLASYRLAHPEARLAAEQRRLLTDWAAALRQRILADNGLTE